MAQRYNASYNDYYENDAGEFVRYEDYAKLEADFKAYKASAYTVAEQYAGVIKELEAELQKYKDQFPDYVECANCGSVTHVEGVEPDEKKSAWIVWCGGENPVPGKRVDVKYRCEYISYDTDSNLYRWRHADAKQDSDIIAYRVVAQNDTRN